jgi:RNA polymerase sigma-70 factor (ECF subfamily)
VKAHLKWRTVGQYDDPVGWIRRVAINRLKDGYRRDARKERAVTRLGNSTEWAAPGPEPDTSADLADVLAELPRQQRLAIAFYYLDSLSVAETAAALGVSEGAVKFHLHQGRERLRAVLGDSRFDDGGWAR